MVYSQLSLCQLRQSFEMSSTQHVRVALVTQKLPLPINHRGPTSQGSGLIPSRHPLPNSFPCSRTVHLRKYSVRTRAIQPRSDPSVIPHNINLAGDELTGADVQKLRLDTPGVVHGIAHLNNAGSSLPSQPVLDASVNYLQQEALTGGYEMVMDNAELLGRCYSGLATMLGCDAEEIAIVQSATIAWQAVFYGIPFQPGDRILTSTAEYSSNYIAFLQVCKRTGAEVEVVPDDEDGQLDVRALERMLDQRTSDRQLDLRTKLVAVTHIPTSTGLVNPAVEIGQVTRKAGVLYLLDACQSVGQVPLDVREIGCDFLTGTGRKYLRAPRGTGFLFARTGAGAKESLDRIQNPRDFQNPKGSDGLEPGMLDNWGAMWSAKGEYTLAPGAQRFETYEMSFAAKAGLAVAVDYALQVGIGRGWRRIQLLAGGLREALSSIQGVEVHDRGRQRCGIVSFTKGGVECESVRLACRAAGVNVSVSRRPSTRLDFEQRGLEEVVRVSVHYYNTEGDLQRLLQIVQTLK